MIDENSTNRRTGVVSDSLCSTAAASIFERNIGATSSSVISVSSASPPARDAR